MLDQLIILILIFFFILITYLVDIVRKNSVKGLKYTVIKGKLRRSCNEVEKTRPTYKQ